MDKHYEEMGYEAITLDKLLTCRKTILFAVAEGAERIAKMGFTAKDKSWILQTRTNGKELVKLIESEVRQLKKSKSK